MCMSTGNQRAGTDAAELDMSCWAGYEVDTMMISTITDKHGHRADMVICTADLQWCSQRSMVGIEDVQNHGLESIGGNEAMGGPKEPALVVAPSFDLHPHRMLSGWTSWHTDGSFNHG